jgi:hypothetical protein
MCVSVTALGGNDSSFISRIQALIVMVFSAMVLGERPRDRIHSRNGSMALATVVRLPVRMRPTTSRDSLPAIAARSISAMPACWTTALALA